MKHCVNVIVLIEGLGPFDPRGTGAGATCKRRLFFAVKAHGTGEFRTRGVSGTQQGRTTLVCVNMRSDRGGCRRHPFCIIDERKAIPKQRPLECAVGDGRVERLNGDGPRVEGFPCTIVVGQLGTNRDERGGTVVCRVVDHQRHTALFTAAVVDTDRGGFGAIAARENVSIAVALDGHPVHADGGVGEVVALVGDGGTGGFSGVRISRIRLGRFLRRAC